MHIRYYIEEFSLITDHNCWFYHSSFLYLFTMGGDANPHRCLIGVNFINNLLHLICSPRAQEFNCEKFRFKLKGKNSKINYLYELKCG